MSSRLLSETAKTSGKRSCERSLIGEFDLLELGAVYEMLVHGDMDYPSQPLTRTQSAFTSSV